MDHANGNEIAVFSCRRVRNRIIRSPVFGDCDSGTEISENTLVLFCVPSHTVSRS